MQETFFVCKPSFQIPTSYTLTDRRNKGGSISILKDRIQLNGSYL